MNAVSHRNDLLMEAGEEILAAEAGCPFRRERDNSFSPEVPVGLIGISYHTAGLPIRSQVGVAANGLKRLLNRFKEEGFAEGLVLSTCNRTEVYFVGGSHLAAEQILAEESGLTVADLQPHFYEKAGACAALHLFGVASGLDSAVLGETEILAQIKDAVAQARHEQCIGRHIDFLVRRSQVASRRIRTETELCRNVTSVGSLAVKEAAQRVGGFADKTLVVIGAGKIAERIAKDLATEDKPNIIFVNRTYANAEGLATRYGGQAQPLSSLEATAQSADVVFLATASDTPILTADAIARIHRARDGRSLTLVDLGVPANADHQATTQYQWDVLDMDALAGRCKRNTDLRIASIPHAMEIMNEELDEFLIECRRNAASPIIEGLVKYTNSVKDENLAWANDKLSHLSEKDLKVVADLAARMAKGFLQTPIHELKEELTSEHHRDLTRKLFKLESGGR